MSQSIFPDYWAEILSRFYVENGQCTDDDRKALCNEWKEKVSEYIESKKAKGQEPWRLENSLSERNGAGATICGLTFDQPNHWNGHVLGDSCIIEVNVTDNDNPFVEKIHTSQEKPFDSYPDFYESFPDRTGRGKIKPCEGSLNDNNRILLVTDPFSEYLSTHKDNREKCAEWLKRIIKLSNHEDYCSLVDEWRSNGLHNDDSTLLIIEYNDNNEMQIIHQDKIEELMAVQTNTPPDPSKNISAPEIQESPINNACNSIAKEKDGTSLCAKNKTVDDEENPSNISREPVIEESTDSGSTPNHSEKKPSDIIHLLKLIKEQVIESVYSKDFPESSDNSKKTDGAQDSISRTDIKGLLEKLYDGIINFITNKNRNE